MINAALGPTGGVEVTIEEDEAHQFIAALNDMRLYASADDSGSEAAREDRQRLIDWLAYCQDSLLEALMG